MSFRFDKIFFVCSLCVIGVIYGMVAASLNIFPFSVFRTAVQAVVAIEENMEQYTSEKPSAVLEKTSFETGGVRRCVPEKAQPGITLVTSFYGSCPGIKLLSLNGTVLHSWPVSLEKLWPDPKHLEERPRDLRTHIHGALLEPDGEVVFNIEYKGLLKMDWDGGLVWKLPYKTHHSICRDAQDGYWVAGRKKRTEYAPQTPMIEPPFAEDYLVHVSSDGEILQEISVLELLFDNRYEGVLLGHGDSDVMLHGFDLTHLNDIEVLDAATAESYPEFDAGDLMVSLRNLNMIFVLDPQSETIQWHQTGPFLRQHDPDFLNNGRISIFDNRDDQAEGAILGGSRILELDPLSGKVETVYEGSKQAPFFTGILGKHQHLQNGNLLITEGQKGRIFEVTPAGDIVWEYVHMYDRNSIAWVEQGHRYSRDYVKLLSRSNEACAVSD
jgi:hypothetical protein